jgi:molybdopterin-containing oxidoreductase family iron-sulfur binding subunit
MSGNGVGRRDFLKVVGAGSAGAAVAGCGTEKVERLIPYVTPPEEITPGVATWYASTCGECAGGCGIRVRTREGRAVMIEGNPDHPISRGGVCSRGVSALQALYNPDRVAAPLRAGPDGFEEITWDEALDLLVNRMGAGGRSLFLTGRKGPTEGGFLDGFVDAVGGQRVIHDALDDSALRRATDIAFGVNTLPRYDIAAADFLVSFGADFLETWLSPVALGADFSAMHGVDHGTKAKFVFVGARLSLTGQNADEWIPALPGSETQIALAVAGELVRRGADAGPYTELVAGYGLEDAAEAAGVEADALAALADGFEAGTGLALGPGSAGHHETATAANLAVLILNAAAGSLGRTMHIDDAPDTEASSYGLVASAIRDMAAGDYGVAVVSGTNPAYSLPPASGFRDAFATVPFKVAFATTLDETSALADLVLPDAHALESWGDAIPAPGTYSVRQPAMRPVPLYDSRPMGDVLLEAGRRLGHDYAAATFRDYLRSAHDAWLAQNGEAAGLVGDPNALWRRLLRTGSVSYTDATPAITALQAPTTAVDFRLPGFGGDGDLTLLVYPSPRFGDGTHANRPWLQEIPDPLLKTAWGCGAEMTPETAAAVGAEDGQLVTLESDHGSVEATVVLNPHMHPGVVAIPIGQGHTDFGRYATGRGVNPLVLLDPAPEAMSGGPRWAGTRVDATARELHRPLARLQQTFDQQGRGIAQAVSRAALEAGDVHPEEEHFSLYPEHEHPTHSWGMAIDLNACNGCNACVAACYAENNVPVLGADRMVRGRTMSWLRIERFVETEPTPNGGARVDSRFLPMLCQHCDHAPCESVCPVYATYHSEEGLNAQIYNRCVGTRYCSNNCPYKVRRFNWFMPEFEAPLNLQLNPDVTARSDGVMEKCSFCVQRIQDGKERARDEDRPVRDGDVSPACAQSCPAQAIVFGDMNDPASRVTQLSADARAYHALSVFNTRPAVTYLKKVDRDA